jgi:molybdopterin molybdotransferase
MTESASAATELLSQVRVLEPFALPLMDALGCVLATAVQAPADVPAFTTVHTAGFAIRVADHVPGETLAIVDEVPAGFLASAPLTAGRCIKVERGAPLPDNADAVVEISKARVVEGGVILEAVDCGQGVTQIGTFIAQGETLARSGQQLDADLLGILARAGIRSVDVHPRPRVLVVTVGSEYVEPGIPTPTGLVADHLSFLAAAIVTELGAIAFRIPAMLDDEAEIALVVDDNAHRSDLIVLCGVDVESGSGIAQALGLHWSVSGCGESVLQGIREGAVVIGLPDDPVLLRICAREILPAVLSTLMGRQGA